MTGRTDAHVVYVGAGLASDLDQYLALGPARIHLIEPNPELAEDLTALSEAHPGLVRHLAQGVTPTGGMQTLVVYSFFDVSGFAEAEELEAAYPGAIRTGSPLVQTLTPDELIQALGLPEGGGHILVIDTPGSEYDLLAAFAAAGHLDNFRDIYLTHPVQPLFVGHRGTADFTGLLTQTGFAPVAETDADLNAHPDWKKTHYRFDPGTKRLRDMQAQLDAIGHKADDEMAEMRALLDAKTRDIEDTQAETVAVRAALKQREADLANAIAERDDLKKQLAAVRAASANDEAARAALSNQCDALQEALTQARALPPLPEATPGSDAEVAMAARLQIAEAAAEGAKQELAMSIRSQAILQSNHLELQGRYETLYRSKLAVDSLVEELLNMLDVPNGPAKTDKHIRAWDQGREQSHTQTTRNKTDP
ncbi:hypothetical protein [Tateyamaria sp. SN6-1]|uniref:hypothetical protein n=1 Tax=Tateyamaria sp. SN6-1 TaxID=3092148 RepID=UPI0039F5782A